jgi:hypothetical protein
MRGYHRLIGVLLFTVKGGGIGRGTAVLISKNLIMTVAHNIYDRNYDCENTNFEFFPSACGAIIKCYKI